MSISSNLEYWVTILITGDYQGKTSENCKLHVCKRTALNAVKPDSSQHNLLLSVI